MKDKKMLSHYDLAKPALKRAKDKAAKEERDILFIERILKFLKPGGRAAIVLPQGKFNNSSLAFIREWILRKARLLAVVGLHQNTFKPHTGTKTSVLFIQKYTEADLAKIQSVKQQVAAACPDYEKEIKDTLVDFTDELDVPEEKLSEAIAELLFEAFGEIEAEVTDESDESENDEEAEESLELEDRIAQAEDKISDLRSELIKEKGKLDNLASDIEALTMTANQEMEVISDHWTGTKKDLNAELKPIKDKLKLDIKALKDSHKEQTKKIKAVIKSLEKAIPDAEFELKKLTNKGKLELLLADDDLMATLKERWIDAEVAKKLDYPIFMAVSERGGKNNSGDYEYLVDEDGNFIEYDDGQPVIDQDLVNFDLTADDLVDADSLSDDKVCIAEAFVQFAQKHQFKFWEKD